MRQSPADRFLEKIAVPSLIAALLTLTGYVVFRIVVDAMAPPTVIPQVALAAKPCAATTAEAMKEIRLQPTRRFTFRDVTYGLHRGGAECTVSRRGGFIGREELVFCEFTNPGALEVATADATYVFAPGPTNPATIWFEDGAPRCGSDSRLNRVRRLLDLRAART